MKKLNIHFLQHVSYETPGTILDWIARHGHKVSFTRFFQKHELPQISEIDWLIIMGGPMSIYDVKDYPWIPEEKKFIKLAVESGKTVIGICLGSQLLADALGARVYKNDEKEIGWYDVELASDARAGKIFSGIDSRIKTFHWHGDTFDLPEKSIQLAASECTINQGFIYESRVYAFQFHLETSRELLERMLEKGGADLTSGKYVQKEEEILRQTDLFDSNRKILFTILDRINDGDQEILPEMMRKS